LTFPQPIKRWQRMSTGSPSLDKLLHGGFPAGQLSLVYGEAASGKSTLALQCSLLCAKQGFQVLYIDADGSLSAQRLEQMASSPPLEVERIGIFTPRNFYQQTVLIEGLERYIHPRVGLVVVDTVNNLYRLAASEAKLLPASNRELNRQLAYLAHISKTHSLPVLLTSQVRSVLEEDFEVDKVEPVATRTLRFWASTILHLKPTPRPNVKVAFLEKLNGRPRSRLFCHLRISGQGLE